MVRQHRNLKLCGIVCLHIHEIRRIVCYINSYKNLHIVDHIFFVRNFIKCYNPHFGIFNVIEASEIVS